MEPNYSPPIPEAIGQAQPVGQQGRPDPWGDLRRGQYARKAGNLYFLKPTRGDSGDRVEIAIPLTCGFCARIVEEILLDDGATTQTAFVIEGQTAAGQLLPAVTVPAASFAAMGWITQHWGARAVLAAGTSVKDHTRAALLLLSGDVPRKTVFSHTGWRHLAGEWVFLSASGAISKTGLQESVSVDLGNNNLRFFRLPPPPDGRTPQVAAGRLLDLLALSPALLAGTVRAVLAEAHPVDFSLFLVGRSGAQKSATAALAQACFGAGFNARNFPAGWHDTAADLEFKAHQAKDGVFVVDDFCPSTSQAEAAKLHATAEKLFRAVGNGAARGRRNADMSAKAAYHPRGLVVATAEDLPRGASLLGRLLVIELRRGEVDLARLTSLQHAARAGELAEGIAGFVRWLAPRLDDLKRTLPRLVHSLRDHALADGHVRSHPRAADMFGSLIAGVEVFLDFLVDARVLTGEEAGELQKRIEAALLRAFEGQGEHQED